MLLLTNMSVTIYSARSGLLLVLLLDGILLLLLLLLPSLLLHQLVFLAPAPGKDDDHCAVIIAEVDY